MSPKKYKYITIQEAMLLDPTKNSYVNIYGVAEATDLGYRTLSIKDETGSLKIKMTYPMPSRHEAIAPGDIIRIHRLLVKNNEYICYDLKSLAIFTSFLHQGHFLVCTNAVKPTICAEDEDRKNELEKWFSDELCDSHALGTLPNTGYSNVIGQVVKVEADATGPFVFWIWDGTTPSISNLDPFRRHNARYRLSSEIDENVSAMAKGRIVHVMVYEPLTTNIEATRINPGDFIALFNVVIEKDKENVEILRKITLHSGGVNGKSIRRLDPQSYMTSLIKNRIDADLVSDMTPSNITPGSYPTPPQPVLSRITPSVAPRISPKRSSPSSPPAAKASPVSTPAVKSTPVTTPAVKPRTHRHHRRTPAPKTPENPKRPRTTVELVEDTDEEEEVVVPEASATLPALLTFQIPTMYFTVQEFMNGLELGRMFSVRAKAVKCLPSKHRLSDVIKIECTNCSFSDSVHSVLGRETDSFMTRVVGTDLTNIERIPCPHCSQPNTSYNFVIFYLIQSEGRPKLLVRLSGFFAASVLGYVAKEALTSKVAAAEIMSRLSQLCPNTCCRSDKKGQLNWIVKATEEKMPPRRSGEVPKRFYLVSVQSPKESQLPIAEHVRVRAQASEDRLHETF